MKETVAATTRMLVAGLMALGSAVPATARQESPQVELSLLDAVELALRHNLQARVARYNEDLAEENITAARAAFDPRVAFSVPEFFSRSSEPQPSQIGGADILSRETVSGGFSFDETLEWGTSWSVRWNTQRNVTNNIFATFNPSIRSQLTFSVQQPLLRNFGAKVDRINIMVAENDFAGSREQFRNQVQQVILDTYQAYWNLAFRIRDLEVKQEALELAEEQLRRNRIQVEIGTLAPIETVQAEQQVAQARVQLIEAEMDLEDAQDALKRLINAEASLPEGWEVEIVPTDEPRYTTEPVDVEAAIAEALEHDPQLRRLRIELRSRRLELDAARNQLLPQVNLTGSLVLNGLGGDRIIRTAFGGPVTEIQEGGFTDALRQVFSGEFNTWSVGVNVSFPLRNLQARAQHARASIRERQTLAQIADREQQVRVAVRQAARRLVSGAEQVAAARTARELAERQLEAEERKFAVGTSTNFQVLQFQRALSDARTQELQAVINFNMARAQLEAAKGTLLENLGVSIRGAGRGGADAAAP